MEKLLRDGIITDDNIHAYSLSRAYVWELMKLVIGKDVDPIIVSKVFLNKYDVKTIKNKINQLVYLIKSRAGLSNKAFELYWSLIKLPVNSTIRRYRFILRPDGDANEYNKHLWLTDYDSQIFIEYLIISKLFSKLTFFQARCLLELWDRVKIDNPIYNDLLCRELINLAMKYRFSHINPITRFLSFISNQSMSDWYYEFLDEHIESIKYTNTNNAVVTFYNMIDGFEYMKIPCRRRL